MFLPISKQDLIERNIDQLDFIYISGDAYIDHPSFGHALISRWIESFGYSIGIIAQPTCDQDYLKLGTPKHAFMVGSGVVDSMVNNYTAAKRRRSNDVYSEANEFGKRPDRALTVYCKNIRRLFPQSTIIIGGIEGSLRRFAHYDYWSDSVMPSILVDTTADLLIYGNGERPIMDIIKMIDKGIPISKIKNVGGTAYLSDNLPKKDYCELPSFEQVKTNRFEYVKAFNIQSQNTDAKNAEVLIQKHGKRYVVQNIPAEILSTELMDKIYALPFERKVHPIYTKGVPAINEVEFSITSHRGCFGNCSFCAIAYHSGRAIQHRSLQSIVDEATILSNKENFKGYIHDLGGPSANFYNPSCEIQQKCGVCKNKNCIGTSVCKNLKVDHSDYLKILQTVRKLPKIKKVFIRSGIRFDYLMLDKNPQFFDELTKYHISGQLKVAPEHISDDVLNNMNKPSAKVYYDFCQRFNKKNEELGLKQYVVPYFISSHPTCTLKDAIELSEYLNSIGYMPEQVQDFYPTPSTKSTTEYYTGINPDTQKPIYIAKSLKDKKEQRALLQWRKKENYEIVKNALISAGRQDLIGNEKKCLIRPNGGAQFYNKKLKKK